MHAKITQKIFDEMLALFFANSQSGGFFAQTQYAQMLFVELQKFFPSDIESALFNFLENLMFADWIAPFYCPDSTLACQALPLNHQKCVSSNEFQILFDSTAKEKSHRSIYSKKIPVPVALLFP